MSILSAWVVARAETASRAFHLYFLQERVEDGEVRRMRIGCRVHGSRSAKIDPATVGDRTFAARRLLEQPPGKCCKVCRETAIRIVNRASA